MIDPARLAAFTAALIRATRGLVFLPVSTPSPVGRRNGGLAKVHPADLGAHKANLFTGPLNYQDGTPFLKAGETATDEQVWSLPQLLQGMEGQSSAK